MTLGSYQFGTGGHCFMRWRRNRVDCAVTHCRMAFRCDHTGSLHNRTENLVRGGTVLFSVCVALAWGIWGSFSHFLDAGASVALYHYPLWWVRSCSWGTWPQVFCALQGLWNPLTVWAPDYWESKSGRTGYQSLYCAYGAGSTHFGAPDTHTTPNIKGQ